jgi:hypothetical protein
VKLILFGRRSQLNGHLSCVAVKYNVYISFCGSSWLSSAPQIRPRPLLSHYSGLNNPVPFDVIAYSGRWSPNWVHSAPRPFTVLLYLPRVIVRMENYSMEWRLAGETEVLGENLPQCTLSTTNPTWPDPGLNPGHSGGKPATNRLRHDAAMAEPIFMKPGLYISCHLDHLNGEHHKFLSLVIPILQLLKFQK